MTRKINELSIPTDGLVLDLPLDGNANARVGNNWTATNMTWVWADRWYVSEVGSFNGSNSYIINPSTSWTILNNDFSISLSFKVDSSASSQWFLYSFWERDLWIRWGNVADNIQFQLFDWTTNAYLNCPVEKNKYYEAVFVRDKINWMSIYLNWVLCASNSYTWNALSWWGRNEQIWRVATSQYFKWQIGLVKIYNKALSQEEIDALYSEGLRRLWPASAQIWRSVNNNFPLYTPASLPTPILDISKPQSWGLYYDQSWNGNNGTPTNVTDSAKGKYNVMSFNGSSSLLNTNYDLDETSDFSISIYWKINTRTFWHFFSTFNDNANNEWWVWSWNVVDWNEWKLFFSWKPYNTYYSNSRVDDNKYHHIVMTRNSSNDELKLYIDWILEINVTESFLQELDAIRCGSNNFNWELLLVKIYDTVLTDKQVEQDYYSSFITN